MGRIFCRTKNPKFPTRLQPLFVPLFFVQRAMDTRRVEITVVLVDVLCVVAN